MPITAPSQEDEDAFCQEVIGTSVLMLAIQFIRANYTPDDIFYLEALDKWARSDGYVRREPEGWI